MTQPPASHPGAPEGPPLPPAGSQAAPQMGSQDGPEDAPRPGPPGRSAPHDTFILANTALQAAPFVPELQLYLATTIIPFWQATEAWLAEHNVDAPFWAFAWPGGLAIARHLIDHPHLAAGKRVLDFAAGCGVAGLAAARAGAASVEMRDINAMAHAACLLNARANGLAVTVLEEEIIGGPCRWDLILAGDVCYEAPMTRHILPWLRGLAGQAEVLIADPGRAYLPDQGMEKLTTYTVPTNLELENKLAKPTSLYWLKPLAP